MVVLAIPLLLYNWKHPMYKNTPCRFITNHLYSSNRDKSIEQFVEDISKLYVGGCSKLEIMEMSLVKGTCNCLNNKHGNISLENSVNYVFSRDEIHNGFGLWYQFDYMLPLHVYNFARTTIKDKGLDFETPLFASFIFFLIVHYKSSSKNARAEIKNLKSKHQSEQNRNHLKILKANKHNARVFYQAQKLYDAIGIKDQHTFVEYVEAIPELEVHYRTTSKSAYDFTSRMYILGIDKLSKRMDDFIRGHTVANDILSTVPMNEITSGVNVANNEVFKLHEKYEKYHIRDKNLYLSYPTLTNNPIIKIERYGKRIKCYIQSEFADFSFIFNSLYKNEIGNGIKSLFRKGFEERPTVTLNKSSDNHLASIRERLINIGVEERTSNSEFYSKFSTPHFEAIQKCMPILSKVSNNGLLVDRTRLIELTKEYRELMKIEGEHYTKRGRRKLIRNLDEPDAEIEDIENKFLKYRAYHSFLVKLIRATNSVRNDGGSEFRIHGLYTPHGASTHRMTCYNVNLQGIPKVFAKEILTA
jgi:hypothetical protein